MAQVNAAHPLLFTPGPLTTSTPVKRAMMVDLGSRDSKFLHVVKDVRNGLLRIAGVEAPEYQAILMQGSGTFGLEATLGSAIPHGGKLLVPCNGAYGKRLAALAKRLNIDVVTLDMPENAPVSAEQVLAALAGDADVTHVAMTHCETSTGLLNPIKAVGSGARQLGKTFIVDAMSSFGAVEIDFRACGIDYLVSSSNKCLQGVPGFSFIVARAAALTAAEGNARSVSMDVHAQLKGLEANGQFRFTPPTHSILAFATALKEFDDEGGVTARAARYAANRAVLIDGFRKMGFKEYLADEHQTHIITSFRYPTPTFNMDSFYTALSSRGFAIYPGKVSDADCFRIGTIGELYPHHMEALLTAVAQVYDPATQAMRAPAIPSANGMAAAVGAGSLFPVKAVVFDWAGTTVDFGSRAPAGCFVELFRRHGVTITVEQARGPMGTNKRDHIAALCELDSVRAQMPNPNIDALYAEFIPLQMSVLASHAALVPGAKEVLAELRSMGVKVGSTTGYSQQMMKIVAPLAARAGYAPDVIVASDDVPTGRPSPFMALEALKLMGVWPPAVCVKVGDTVADVHEGVNAGMWTVGLTTTGNELGLSEDELKQLSPAELQARCSAAKQRLDAAGAHYVVDTLPEVTPLLHAIAERIRRGERP